MMSFDAASLLFSLIPSGLGFVLLVYGKKQGRVPHIIAGLLFTVYPYFATSLESLIGVGALIGAGFWYAVKSGY